MLTQEQLDSLAVDTNKINARTREQEFGVRLKEILKVITTSIEDDISKASKDTEVYFIYKRHLDYVQSITKSRSPNIQVAFASALANYAAVVGDHAALIRVWRTHPFTCDQFEVYKALLTAK